MATTNRPTVKTRNANVGAGIDKHITSNVTIGGVAYAPADLKAVFQNESAALDASDALHKQWQDQVAAARTASTKSSSVYQLLRAYLVGLYGTGSKATLNDFGMRANKTRTPLTVEAKAVAAQKRTATREARHTTGKVQKKVVKGDVTGVIVTPITTAPSPVASTPSPLAPGATPATPVGPTTPASSGGAPVAKPTG